MLFHEAVPLAPIGAEDDVVPTDRIAEPEQYTNASVNTYPSGNTTRSLPLPKNPDAVLVNLKLNSLSGFVAYAPLKGSSKWFVPFESSHCDGPGFKLTGV